MPGWVVAGASGRWAPRLASSPTQTWKVKHTCDVLGNRSVRVVEGNTIVAYYYERLADGGQNLKIDVNKNQRLHFWDLGAEKSKMSLRYKKHCMKWTSLRKNHLGTFYSVIEEVLYGQSLMVYYYAYTISWSAHTHFVL